MGSRGCSEVFAENVSSYGRPGPTARIVPVRGVSVAVSGMMIPEDVMVSGAEMAMRTRSWSGWGSCVMRSLS